MVLSSAIEQTIYMHRIYNLLSVSFFLSLRIFQYIGLNENLREEDNLSTKEQMARPQCVLCSEVLL